MNFACYVITDGNTFLSGGETEKVITEYFCGAELFLAPEMGDRTLSKLRERNKEVDWTKFQVKKVLVFLEVDGEQRAN